VIVLDRGLALAAPPQPRRQPGAGAHVRPCLEDAPEVARVLLEGALAEGALASFDRLIVEGDRLTLLRYSSSLGG
jgi:hypothetical protein